MKNLLLLMGMAGFATGGCADGSDQGINNLAVASNALSQLTSLDDCEAQSGACKGLCTAYVATGCSAGAGNPRACDRIATNYAKHDCEAPACFADVVCPAGFVCDTAAAAATSHEAFCISEDGSEAYIPAGTYLRGCTTGDPFCHGSAMPPHRVTTDAYAIDRTEVTAGAYAEWCIDDTPAVEDTINGICTPRYLGGFNSTYGDPARLDRPINWVSWPKANAYCAAAGKRLCTEAEWERAALGGCETLAGDCDGQRRLYPWGDQPASCELAIMREGQSNGCGTDDVWPVGSRPAGASPYGALDMAGNLREWVADVYAGDTYCLGPDANITSPFTYCSAEDAPYADPWVAPTGPADTGEFGAWRGGGFSDAADGLVSAVRMLAQGRRFSNGTVGFRCCRDL